MTTKLKIVGPEPKTDKEFREQQAREDAEDLTIMDEAYMVMTHLAGKCRVVYKETSTFQGQAHTCYRLQSHADFHHAHENKIKRIYTGMAEDETGKPVPKYVYGPISKWWLKHPHRRGYKDFVMDPSTAELVVLGNLNIWEGFAFYPTPAVDPDADDDLLLETDEHGSCKLWLDHVRDNICRGNKEHFDYLIMWLARAVQQPDLPGEVAIVMRGKEGTGKNIFADAVRKLFNAAHSMAVTSTDHLLGHFNAHLRSIVLLFADEAFVTRNERHEQLLKTLITSSTLTIEKKGVDVVVCPNFIHLIMATNSEWAVPAGPDARRFFVLDVGAARMQDIEYFDAITEQLKAKGNSGYKKLLRYLIDYPLRGFNWRDVPQTEALAEQKAHTRRGIDSLIEDLCNDGVLPWAHTSQHSIAITSGEEHGKGFAWWALNKPDFKGKSWKWLSGQLSKWGTKPWHDRERRGIEFPPLVDLRAAFADRHHCTPTWDNPSLVWGPPAPVPEERRGGADVDEEIPF